MAVTNQPPYPSDNVPNAPNYIEQAKPVIVVGGSVPAAITEDGEMWTTTTERENDVASIYQTTLTATKYFLLISKNNPNFPHIIQGQPTNRIDISSMYYALDVPANGQGSIAIGVITRIDGANADIKNVFGIPFFNAAKVVVVDSLRGTPSQVKFDFDDSGVLQHAVTNIAENNVAAVNLAVNLDSPIGNISPGLGDIIIKYTHTNGTTPFTVFAFYHTH